MRPAKRRSQRAGPRVVRVCHLNRARRGSGGRQYQQHRGNERHGTRSQRTRDKAPSSHSVATPPTRSASQRQRMQRQFKFDFAACAPARACAEAETSQKRSSRQAFPARRRREAVETVASRAVQQALCQRRADAFPLPLVGHLERDSGDPRPIDVLHVASNADDRVVARIDRGKGLVPDMIDIGEEDEFAVGELSLRHVESSVARL